MVECSISVCCSSWSALLNGMPLGVWQKSWWFMTLQTSSDRRTIPWSFSSQFNHRWPAKENRNFWEQFRSISLFIQWQQMTFKLSILVVFKNSKNTGLRPQICMIVRMLKSQCRIRRTPWTEIPIELTCFRMGFVSSADFHRMCTWGHPEVSLAPSVLLALSRILALYPSFPSHRSHAKKPNRRTRNRSADAWKEYWTF